MSETRHPDIEVYVKECNGKQLTEWLASIAENLSTPKTSKDTTQLTATLNGVEIDVLIQERVVGKAWTSIWFDSAETPWLQDLDCAKQIAADLDTQTRCIVGGWEEGDDPDEWWKVHKGNEEKIVWATN